MKYFFLIQFDNNIPSQIFLISGHSTSDLLHSIYFFLQPFFDSSFDELSFPLVLSDFTSFFNHFYESSPDHSFSFKFFDFYSFNEIPFYSILSL